MPIGGPFPTAGGSDFQGIADAFMQEQGEGNQRIQDLLTESQQPRKKGLVGKLTPVLESLAFLIDATSGNRKKRSEAGGKLRAVQDRRAGRETAVDQKRRQKLLDQIGIEELTGRQRAQTFQTQAGVEERRRTSSFRGKQLDIAGKDKRVTAKEQDSIDARKMYEGIVADKREPSRDEAIFLNANGYNYPIPQTEGEKYTAGLQSALDATNKAFPPKDKANYEEINGEGSWDVARESYWQRQLQAQSQIAGGLPDQPTPDLQSLEEDFNPADFLPAVDGGGELGGGLPSQGQGRDAILQELSDAFNLPPGEGRRNIGEILFGDIPLSKQRFSRR